MEIIIKILWVIMVSIIIFAFGFSAGCDRLGIKIYNAMIDALNSVSVEENGADYVKGVIYACNKVEEAMKKEKEDEECQ